MTKRIFITFCAAAACCVLLGACESGSLAAAAGKRTRPADLGELQFITPAEGDPIATLSTTLGDISFVLYPDIAPWLWKILSVWPSRAITTACPSTG